MAAATDKQKPALSKATAKPDMNAIMLAITNPEPTELAENRILAGSLLNKLREDENALRLARQQGLVKTGLDLIAGNACPLCDREWDATELREYLERKLLSAEEISRLLDQLRQARIFAGDRRSAFGRELLSRGEVVDAQTRYAQRGYEAYTSLRVWTSRTYMSARPAMPLSRSNRLLEGRASSRSH